MTDLTPYLNEARARGLQWAVNDARSWARASVDRFEADSVGLSSLQSWASILVLVEAVEAGKLTEPLPSLSGSSALVPPDDVVITSAADFAAWWNAQPDERRWDAFARIREWSESSQACFLQNHQQGLLRANAEIASLREQLEALREQPAANVSRETSHLDPLRLQLGQLVDAFALPLQEGDAPVARGTFVHVTEVEGLGPHVVLDAGAEGVDRLRVDRHVFKAAR